MWYRLGMALYLLGVFLLLTLFVKRCLLGALRANSTALYFVCATNHEQTQKKTLRKSPVHSLSRRLRGVLRWYFNPILLFVLPSADSFTVWLRLP